MAKRLTHREPLKTFQGRFAPDDYDFMLSKGGAEYLRKLVKRERKSEQMKMAKQRKEVG